MRIDFPPRVGSGSVESAYALLDALARLGLRHLVLAPGSRSAPLVYAAHALGERGPRVHVRHDERAAAFTALGLSRGGDVAAVATTSGTATAHLLAAAMEAHHSGIPLLLLTADRPAELRGTGANQTTIQPGIFGTFAEFFDLPAPAADEASEGELRLAVDTAARAYAHACSTRGPVHLNVCFRDPLTPKRASDGAALHGIGLSVPVRDVCSPAGVGIELPPRTVILVGDADPVTGAQAHALAVRESLPLLAEPSSNARLSRDVLVPAYAHVLAEVMARPDHPLRPQHVLVFGHATLTRPVARDLLSADGIDITVVSERHDWPDTGRRASRIVPVLDCDATTVGTDNDGAEPAAALSRQEWSEGWRSLGARLHTEALTKATEQAHAALAVWKQCAVDGAPLLLGASALIRDVDLLADAGPMRVHANRGLAGIDGTVSTATGIALAHQMSVNPLTEGARSVRTRVLLGDVTAIHDLTGFVIGPTEEEACLDIVIVDDNGGRIFSGLEHAVAPPALLERCFTTPHGLDLVGVVQSLGIPTVRTTASGLDQHLRNVPQSAGRRAFVVQVGLPDTETQV